MQCACGFNWINGATESVYFIIYIYFIILEIYYSDTYWCTFLLRVNLIA